MFNITYHITSMIQNLNLEQNFKPTAECEIRVERHFRMHFHCRIEKKNENLSYIPVDFARYTFH